VEKIFCDMSRVCEVEDQVIEWYDSRYFQRRQELFNLDFLRPLFKVMSVECGGVDGLVCKVQLKAEREGRLENAYVGMPIEVRAQDKSFTVEVKRAGLHIDRFVDLQVRIGDILVFYISQTVA